MKLAFRSFLLLSLLTVVSFAQQQPQVASVVHDLHKFNSQVLGEERSVLVRLPADYARSGVKYPVVYMLDAHPPQNAMMIGIVEQQAWGGQIPEMIVVGIQNVNRNRDLTPTKTERQGSGGGDKFLDFLEKEVIPLVDRTYRTEPFRVFAGHSLGGLTVVYAMASRPDMFGGYIAASPVLHWDKDFVIKKTQEAFKNRKDWKKTLFVGLGNEPDYDAGFNSFRELLKKADHDGLQYEFQRYPNDNHGSVGLPVYYAGLRKIFNGWVPPATGNLSDLETHYRKLSDRFGFKISVPENLMNQVGYLLLRENKGSEAIEVFKKNVDLYPNSANTYDSLGEAYETTGQLKQAASSYEKAYKMAETRGETQLAVTAKANFQRVSAKIK